MIIKQFLTVVLLTFYSATATSQIDADTLFFKNIEIRVYSYKIETDTITIAYFDDDTPKAPEKRPTNLGEMRSDKTFNSIANYVRLFYSNASVKMTDLESGKIVSFSEELILDSKSAITIDSYLLGAIDHYARKIKTDSSNHSNYFNLANSLVEYHSLITPNVYNRIMPLLNTCIRLNMKFEKAYFLKSRIHEAYGIFMGMVVSGPHIDVVDLNEIELAIKCLNQLLDIDHENKEAKDYRNELIEKYKM